MELPGRRYPISVNGIAHIPRTWIMGGPDSYSLCESVSNVWGQRWGTKDEAERGCHSCLGRIQKRIDWYEDLKGELG